MAIAFAVASFYFAQGTGLSGYTLKEQPVVDKLATLLAAYDAKPFHLDARVADANCHLNGPLPDHACTPGAVFPEATREIICVSGYTKTVRNVSASLKKRVYLEYGFAYPQASGAFEADHLIPLELGGNNDIANLFPEPGLPKPGFHEKDLVENYLNHKMCDGSITLAAAQQQIANDWVSVYNTLTPNIIEQLKHEFAGN